MYQSVEFDFGEVEIDNKYCEVLRSVIRSCNFFENNFSNEYLPKYTSVAHELYASLLNVLNKVEF